MEPGVSVFVTLDAAPAASALMRESLLHCSGPVYDGKDFAERVRIAVGIVESRRALRRLGADAMKRASQRASQ